MRRACWTEEGAGLVTSGTRDRYKRRRDSGSGGWLLTVVSTPKVAKMFLGDWAAAMPGIQAGRSEDK